MFFSSSPKNTPNYKETYHSLNYTDLLKIFENEPEIKDLIRDIVREELEQHRIPPTTKQAGTETEQPVFLTESTEEISSPLDLSAEQPSKKKQIEQLTQTVAQQTTHIQHLEAEKRDLQQQLTQWTQYDQYNLPELHDYFELVQELKANHPALLDLLTGEKNGASDHVPLFLRIMTRLGQFPVLTQVWDQIADICKQQKRAATETENLILTIGLSLCNCNWKTPARFVCPLSDTPYDYAIHQRLDSQMGGDKIARCVLMGLSNAAGALTRKPLVVTI